MTRKNMKGIVGVETPTKSKRYPTGVGLDFKKENTTTSEEIEQAIKKKKS